jgi:hypothetical protein
MSAIAAAAITAGGAIIGAGVNAGMQASGASAASRAAREAALLQMQQINDWYAASRQRMMPYQQFGRQQLPIYQQALQDYANAVPGYWNQLGNYQQAVDAYRQTAIPGVEQAIRDYQTVAPQYQQAMRDYGGALQRYEGMVGGLGATAGEMGDLAKRYQQAVNRYYGAAGKYEGAIPEMTRAFTQADYEASPVYTPMVRNLAELQATPGYQFELEQGQKELAQSAAARGGTLSGAQLQASRRFGQQQAATGFQNAWQRAQNAYQTALGQHQNYQKQMAGVLGENVGNYATGAQLTGAERDIISGKAGIQAQQLSGMGTALGGYNTAVGQVGGLGDLYNTGYNQQLGRAGLYGNVADMARGGAGLYAGGMGLMQQNVANRLGGLQFGYGANTDMNQLGLSRVNAINQALGGYGSAGAAGSMAQGNIWGNAIGQGLGGLAGGLANTYGGPGGWGSWFGAAPATGGWGDALGNMGQNFSGINKPYKP